MSTSDCRFFLFCFSLCLTKPVVASLQPSKSVALFLVQGIFIQCVRCLCNMVLSEVSGIVFFLYQYPIFLILCTYLHMFLPLIITMNTEGAITILTRIMFVKCLDFKPEWSWKEYWTR